MSFPELLSADFSATVQVSRRSTTDAATGHAPREAFGQDALPPGTRLQEYEIVRVLGAGGFGIVYLAHDRSLLREVAIKEFMPVQFACRGVDGRVEMRQALHAQTFEAGLRSFIFEAQLLARFDHPALVRVYRYWEDNGTAYMAMQYHAGRTLKQARLDMALAPDERWLRSVVDPLLGALEVLHAQGVSHRDVAPDNILLLPDGRPVLLDFGAARHVIGDRTHALTSILKPNFASIEQYADVPGLSQGPWTDLYALGAVLHYMLTAKAPVPAAVRAVHDDLMALSAPGGPSFGLSTPFVRAIDWALAVHPQDRPQSVQAFRDAISGAIQPPPPPLRPVGPIRVGTAPPALATPAALRRIGMPWVLAALGLTVAGLWASRAPDPAPPLPATLAIRVPVQPLPDLPPEYVANVEPAQATTVAALQLQPVATAAMPRRTPPGPRPTSNTTATTYATTNTVRPAMVPPGPREVCGERNNWSLALCIHRECLGSQFRQHPQCLQLKREAEVRREEEATRR